MGRRVVEVRVVAAAFIRPTHGQDGSRQGGLSSNLANTAFLVLVLRSGTQAISYPLQPAKAGTLTPTLTQPNLMVGRGIASLPQRLPSDGECSLEEWIKSLCDRETTSQSLQKEDRQCDSRAL